MFVKQPSFSACAAAGRKKTSVPIRRGGQLAARDFRRIHPERRRLSLHHIAHDEPFQVRKRSTFKTRIGRTDRGVLSHHEQAFDLCPSRRPCRAHIRSASGLR